MYVTYDISCVTVVQHFHASWDSKVLAEAYVIWVFSLFYEYFGFQLNSNLMHCVFLHTI